jgi:ribulose-phosphate 3-epimerase
MKSEIAPSILSFPVSRLATAIPEMARAGATVLHLDIMDGQFVPPISFGDALARDAIAMTDALAEAHLMTLTPERHFDAFIEAGCRRIIFHAEATVHSHRLVQTLKSAGVQAGIAINPGTPVSFIEPILDLVDMVLVMTVNPGWGGQRFIEATLDKVRQLRAFRADLDIEVDGGIDPITLPVAQAAGANLFVVGSHLAKAADLTGSTKELVALCD